MIQAHLVSLASPMTIRRPPTLTARPSALAWRFQKKTTGKGIKWLLIRGGGARGKRQNLTMGYVTADEAGRALARLNEAESGGRAGVLLNAYAADPALFVRMMIEVGDGRIDSWRADQGADWSRVTLAGWLSGSTSPIRDEVTGEIIGLETFADWRRAVVGPKSFASEQSEIGRLLPRLGGVLLADIDPIFIADYLDTLRATRGPREGLRLSGNSKRLRRQAIQVILDRAYRLRHIPAKIRLADVALKESTRTVHAQRDPLNLEELGALMDALTKGRKVNGRRLTGQGRALVALGAANGLRPSEICRVHWEDLNLITGTIAVRGEKTAASSATVPLTPIARKALLRYRGEVGSPEVGPVFVTRYGAPYSSDSGFKKMLRGAARRAGITEPDQVTPYLLRHSFATIAFLVGLDKDLTRRIGRWTDQKMLDRVYSRPRAEDWAGKLDAFDW